MDNCDLPFGFENQYYDGVNPWLTLRDPEPMIAKVIELGGEVVDDADHPSGRAIKCRDDPGRRFDLHQPAPGYGLARSRGRWPAVHPLTLGGGHVRISGNPGAAYDV